MSLLYLGNNQIVNTDHIVRIAFDPPELGGEQRYDEDSGQNYTTAPIKAKLVLTLTALEIKDVAEDHGDYGGAYHLAAASKSQTVTVRGDPAERAWEWFQERSMTIVDAVPWPEDD